MFNVIIERLKQKKRTSKYPKTEVTLTERYRGLPRINTAQCSCSEQICSLVCPTGAITFEKNLPQIDLGKCLFCLECSRACPKEAISFSNNYHLATTSRNSLILTDKRDYQMDKAIEVRKEIIKLFGRSLKLRQVSAGGCNACEADTNVLGTPFFDLARFGIQIVASPRHADGILVTGPITNNMKLALKKTYDAIPSPKIVIATGSCAISGGPFQGNEEVNDGIDSIIPVDLYIPGCPPHPMTILDGMLQFLNKIKHLVALPQKKGKRKGS